MLLTAAITTFGFNHHVVIPVLARRTFGGGAGVYTLLASAMAAGAVLGALVGARGPRSTYGRCAGAPSPSLGP